MNKPVAWAIKADNDFTEIGFDDDLLEEIEQMYVMEGWKYEVIPLYTHPVKELTDEEILNEWLLTNYNPKTYVWANDTDDDLVLQFAKEILRKAQNK